MSKRAIQIEIDAEDETCGACDNSGIGQRRRGPLHPVCSLFGKSLDRLPDERPLRCDACKAAEVKQAANTICPECDDRPIRSGLLYSMCPKHELAALVKRAEVVRLKSKLTAISGQTETPLTVELTRGKLDDGMREEKRVAGVRADERRKVLEEIATEYARESRDAKTMVDATHYHSGRAIAYGQVVFEAREQLLQLAKRAEQNANKALAKTESQLAALAKRGEGEG